MTKLRNTECLTATSFTSPAAKDVIQRLRSDPGLILWLAVPTETARVRAIKSVEGGLKRDAVAYTTDNDMVVKFENGSLFYVVVDVNQVENLTALSSD